MLHRRAFLVAILGAILLVAMIGTAGASGTHHPAVSVSPAVGGPHSRFTVSFRAPAPAGRTGTQQATYVISASTSAANGCRSTISRSIASARKGQAERVHLSAGHSSRLCAGVYKGSVMLMRAPACGPPTMMACSMSSAVFGHRVGTFRFRVK